MNNLIKVIIGVVALVILLVLSGLFYIVDKALLRFHKYSRHY